MLMGVAAQPLRHHALCMSERSGPQSDVLVLGAGMAGLCAARELSRRGLAVTLLEARARLGGRILTEDVFGWSTPVELGAEFVHGRPVELLELIDAAGLTREPSHAPHVRKAERGLDTSRHNPWNELESALDAVHLDERDLSAAEFIARGTLSSDAARMFAGYLEGFHAGELHRISLRSVLRQASDDDKEQGRLREGYSRLVEFLSRDLVSFGVRIVLKSRINVVRWEQGAVLVVADGAEWHAKAALVALPLSILKAGTAGDGVSFEPEPAALRRGLDALEMGHALRVVFRLRGPLGLAETLPHGSFVHGVAGEFPTFWLGGTGRETQVTAWCGGPRAARLGELDAPSIVHAATESLAAAFDVPVVTATERLLGAHVHSFGSDPFSRGAYPYALVGGEASGCFDPVSQTLFFAGDYTVPEELGTVGIAVKSGALAARKIAEVLAR